MRFTIGVLLIAFGLLCLTPSSNAAGGYSAEKVVQITYPEIKTTSLEILKKFPPEEYYYLSIGSSPLPFSAFFENLGISDITTIPLSGMKKLGKIEGIGREKLDSRIQQHLSQWMPSRKELKGKKILVLDYAGSGSGLIAATNVIKSFVEARRLGTEVQAVGLVPATMPGTREKLLELGIFPIEMESRGRLASAMTYMWYKPWSKFGKWYAWNAKTTSFKSRSEYDEFKKALGREMKADTELSSRLPEAQQSTYLAELRVSCISQGLNDILRFDP
jgi:hypothetical protein